MDSKSEAGVSSGEAGLEGIFKREEIRERKVKTGLVGGPNQKALTVGSHLLDQRRLRDNRRQVERLSVVRPRKRIKKN